MPDYTKSDDFFIVILIFHLLGFLATQFVFGIILSDMEWKSQKSAFRIMASFTAFTVIYLYNPWIVAYQVEGARFYQTLKGLTAIQSFSVPIILAANSCSTFILWRMSRIEADYEPCEVIYGAEDSETKKLMEYYE